MSIIVDKISLSFGDKQMLDDFSCQLPDVGVACLIGPSGSGKTTLFNCLAGILKPDSGSISGLQGKRKAILFQENRLLPWYNALANVAFVVKDDKGKAAHFLEQVELNDAAGKYPNELSGGMQRRVAIARALAYGGDILMLDEPTTGLDDELAQRIMHRIVEQWQDKLVILVTHDQQLAEMFATERFFVEKKFA